MTGRDLFSRSTDDGLTTELPEPLKQSLLSRRNALSLGGLGVAGLAVAACSSGPASTGPETIIPATPTSSGSAAPAGQVITKVADVPVGSAIITEADNQSYVVAQQSAGVVECYTAICTHQGCFLNQIQGDEALCPCHGSRFNIFTGAAVRGPAIKPLANVAVKVEGGNVVAG